MKRLAAVGLSAAVALAATASVHAADLPQPEQPYTYDEPVPAERFDWSGFYFGGHLGWNWSDFDTSNGVTGNFSTRDNGVTGGVHAGYNYMLTPEFLLGAEADFSLADVDKSRTVAGVAYKTSSDWNGTVRARAGWAFDRFLVFGTGGLAIADMDVAANGAKDSSTRIGWTAGAGVEGAVTQNVTARLEYQYQDYGSETFSLGGQSYKTDLNNNQVRFGLSYKF
ncbi:outer membrane protein [Stappia stellulata]|uniref:outer membrane protein n=1 Tax=Stappia stellulata TaxID=71235 RepID=UPI00041CCA7F|nr:outer membrane protein [Stappia stellulata]